MSVHRILCLVVSVDRDATSLCRLTITNPLGVVEVSNKKGFWEAQNPLLAEDTRFELVRA